MSNMDAARVAEKEFGAEIVVIKKTSKDYGQMKDPLPCPSVVVNGRIIAKNDTVSQQALKAAILSDSEV
ncbi:MAG: hypothetical protein A2X58_01030 [Nitrospirae bacterium GWC2_56_14]|nr:MAG: hypothetical protein A2X58_01030 [Nitrospirae bacterium GWC2_56_14]